MPDGIRLSDIPEDTPAPVRLRDVGGDAPAKRLSDVEGGAMRLSDIPESAPVATTIPASDALPAGNLERPGTAKLNVDDQARQDWLDTSPKGLADVRQAIARAHEPQNFKNNPREAIDLEQHLADLQAKLEARPFDNEFNTRLTPEQVPGYQAWKELNAPRDSGVDYDLPGAYLAGLSRSSPDEHLPDTFKKPNHPTFSDQSQYAAFGQPGRWEGDTFVPPGAKPDLIAPTVDVVGHAEAAPNDYESMLAPDQIASGVGLSIPVQSGPHADPALRGSVMADEIAPGPSPQPAVSEEISARFADVAAGQGGPSIGPQARLNPMRLSDPRLFDTGHIGGEAADTISRIMGAAMQGASEYVPAQTHVGAAAVRFLNDAFANPRLAQYGVDALDTTTRQILEDTARVIRETTPINASGLNKSVSGATLLGLQAGPSMALAGVAGLVGAGGLFTTVAGQVPFGLQIASESYNEFRDLGYTPMQAAGLGLARTAITYVPMAITVGKFYELAGPKQVGALLGTKLASATGTVATQAFAMSAGNFLLDRLAVDPDMPVGQFVEDLQDNMALMGVLGGGALGLHMLGRAAARAVFGKQYELGKEFEAQARAGVPPLRTPTIWEGEYTHVPDEAPLQLTQGADHGIRQNEVPSPENGPGTGGEGPGSPDAQRGLGPRGDGQRPSGPLDETGAGRDADGLGGNAGIRPAAPDGTQPLGAVEPTLSAGSEGVAAGIPTPPEPGIDAATLRGLSPADERQEPTLAPEGNVSRGTIPTAVDTGPRPIETETHPTVETPRQFIDNRLSPAVRGELQAMAANAGWAQVGGRMIRNEQGEVTGRTEWIGHEDWWQGRPGGLNKQQTQAAVAKALAGEKLGANETKAVKGMVEVALERLAVTQDFEAEKLPKTPENYDNTQLAAWALEHHPDEYDRLAMQFPDDDAGFFGGLRELHGNSQAGDGGGTADRGEAQGGQGGEAGGETKAGQEVARYAGQDAPEFELSPSPGPTGAAKAKTAQRPVSRLSGGQTDLFTEREQPAAVVRSAEQFATTTHQVRLGTFHAGINQVNSAADAAHVFAPLRREPIEHAQMLVLDKDRKPIAIMRLGIGARTQTTVFPSVMAQAAHSMPGARWILFAHNHPSGIPNPSGADQGLVAQIKRLLQGTGVELAGNIIIAGQKARAFGMLDPSQDGPVDMTPHASTQAIPETGFRYLKNAKLSEVALTSPAQSKTYLETLPEPAGVLLLDAQNFPRAWMPLAIKDLERLRTGVQGTGASKLLQAIQKSAAATMILKMDQPNANAVANLNAFTRSADVHLLDAFHPDKYGKLVSMAEQGVLGGGHGDFRTPANQKKPWYFSQLTRSVEALKTESMPVEQWRGTIANLIKNGGAKATEVQETGLNDWLDLQTGKVSRADVVAYLKTAAIEPREHVLGGDGGQFANLHVRFGHWIPMRGEREDMQREFRAMAITAELDGQSYDYEVHYDPQENATTLRARDPGGLDGGWRDVLDGGGAWDNPAIEHAVRDDLANELQVDDQPTQDTSFDTYTQPGGTNYREILHTIPALPGGDEFKSAHFSQKNIIAHQRVKDDVDEQNRPGLRLEELQTDWGEQARKIRERHAQMLAKSQGISQKAALAQMPADAGFKRPDMPEAQILSLLDEAGYKAEHNGVNWVVTNKTPGGPVPNKLTGDTGGRSNIDRMGDETPNQFAGSLAQVAQMVLGRLDLQQPFNALPRAPFVTKTEAWVSLLMKRAIHYAVTHGQQWVAWPHGDKQVAMYSYALQKAVDRIEWEKTPDGVHLVGYQHGTDPSRYPTVPREIWDAAREAVLRNDSLGFNSAGDALNAVVEDHADWQTRWEVTGHQDRIDIERYITAKRQLQAEEQAAGKKVVDTTEAENALSDAIGKSMAEQILQDPNQKGTISGKDIKVADTGMAGFYDRMVPAITNGILKKLGGGRVGTIRILNPEVLRSHYVGPTHTLNDLREQLQGPANDWPVMIRTQLQDVMAVMNRRQGITTFELAMQHYASPALAEKLGGKMEHTPPEYADWHGFEVTPELARAVTEGGGLSLFTRATQHNETDMEVAVTTSAPVPAFVNRLDLGNLKRDRDGIQFATVVAGTPVGREFASAFNDVIAAGVPLPALGKVHAFALIRAADTGGMFSESSKGGGVVSLSAAHLERASKLTGPDQDALRRDLRGWLAHELTHAMDAGDRAPNAYRPMDHYASVNSPRLAFDRKNLYPLDDLRHHGDLFAEAWGIMGRHDTPSHPVRDLLKYPFLDMLRWRWKDEQVKVELFAQMGRLYFTSPDLMRRHLPNWYTAMKEIFEHASPIKSVHDVSERIQRSLSGRSGRALDLDPNPGSRTNAPDARGDRLGDVPEGVGGAETGPHGPDLESPATDRKRTDSIRAYVRKVFGAPVSQGLLGRSKNKYLGFYRSHYETIHLANQNDLDTLSHEVGHHISNTERSVRTLMQTYDRELLRPPFAHPAYAKANKAKRTEEGFAEYIRLYLTDRAQAAAAAPGFTGAFEAFLNANPKYKEPIAELTRRITANRSAAPEDMILGKVGRPKATIGELITGHTDQKARDKLVYEFLDRWKPLSRVVDDLQPGILPHKNPYIAARLLAGDAAMVEDWLVRWTIPFDTAKRLDRANFGKPLMAILEPVMKDEATSRKFAAYLIARQANELSPRDMENLYTPAEIRAGLTLHTPQFEAVADELAQFHDQLLQYRVDAGILTPELADKFRQFEYFAPFFRMAEGFQPDSPASGHGITIHRRKGGTANLRDVIENTIESTARTIRAANRNHVVQLLADLVRKVPGSGDWAELVPIPQTALTLQTKAIIEKLEEQGVTVDTSMAQNLAAQQTFFQRKPLTNEKKGIYIFMQDGKYKALKINDEQLWNTLNRMEPQEIGLLLSMFSFPARIARAGIVLTPQFMESNFFRDTLAAAMQSKTRFLPVISNITGSAKALEIRHGSKILKQMSDSAVFYRALGGAYPDMWHEDSEDMKALIARIAKRTGWARHLILTPAGVIRLIEKAGGAIEAGPRISEFEGVRRDELAKGTSPVDAALMATFAGREVSTDFAQHGANQTLRTIARTTLFLNPAIQGLRKAGKTMSGMEGKRSLFKVMMTGGTMMLGSILLYLANRDEDWYKEIEDWERNTYWHFKIGDEIYRLMKPFEYGLFYASIPEAMTEHVIKHNGPDLRDRITQGIGMVLGFRVVPHVPSVLMQWAYNYDDFLNRRIVPDAQSKMEPDLQRGDRSSVTARVLAKGTNQVGQALEAAGYDSMGNLVKTSPTNTDWLTRQLFGGLGQYVVMASDQTLRLLGDYPAEPTSRWQSWPIVNRFIHNPDTPQTRQITQFYKDLENIRRQAASVKQYTDAEADAYEKLHAASMDRAREAEKTAKVLSGMRKEAREVSQDPVLTGDQKRDQLNAIYKGMRQEARDYIEER